MPAPDPQPPPRRRPVRGVVHHGTVPRSLRYVLLWLSCTSLSVTAVNLTVQFVVGTTRPTPPVARDTPGTVVSSPVASPEPSRSPASMPPATRRPSPPPPPPKAPASPAARPSPAPTPSATATDAGDGDGCRAAGAQVRTYRTTGGRASLRFGDGVCLVSAVPAGGFTVSTERGDPRRLTVTFTSDSFRSQITATATPSSGYSVSVRQSTL
ncbi:hypothetical protein GCM10010420_45160 [Streptomyces glaucosporus]|uniref:Secreted protein n=1 Tax=Streptomyces glaucosporus TaxID=284044 RepID=A0ABN3IQW4_9ACTN